MITYRKKSAVLILICVLLFLFCACASSPAAPASAALPEGGVSAEHGLLTQNELLPESGSSTEVSPLPDDDGWYLAKGVHLGEEREELHKCYTLEEVQLFQESMIPFYLQTMCENQGFTLAEDAQSPCTHNFYQPHGFEGFIAKDAESHFYYRINIVVCNECKVIISAEPGIIREEPHEFPPYEETDPHWGDADSIFYTTYPDGCYCSYPVALTQETGS